MVNVLERLQPPRFGVRLERKADCRLIDSGVEALIQPPTYPDKNSVANEFKHTEKAVENPD